MVYCFRVAESVVVHCCILMQGTHRAAVTLTAVRPHGKLRLDSVSAHLPTGKWARRSGERIRKESTVGTFLTWRSFGTFLSTGREKYIESITLINCNLKNPKFRQNRKRIPRQGFAHTVFIKKKQNRRLTLFPPTRRICHS